MENSRNTRKSLIASGIVMLLCIAMLVGATFAWFTDSVTNSGNIIKAGNLDVKFEYAEADGEVDWNTAVWKDASEGTMFEYTDWEPGYSEGRYIRITNVGSLALKYQIRIVPNGDVGKLAEAIDVYLTNSPAYSSSNLSEPVGTLAEILENEGILKGDLILANDGQLYPEGSDGGLQENTFTVVLKMREEADNDYQGLSIGAGFKIQLIATQWTYEEDGFGNNQYDANAKYPIISNVGTADELIDALNGGVPADITLSDNINNAGRFNLDNVDATIDLNNKSITVSSTAVNEQKQGLIVSSGTLTLTNTNPNSSQESSIKISGNPYRTSLLNADGSNSTLNITDGIYKCSAAESILVQAANDAVINISGGSYSTSGATSTAFYANGGTIIITKLDSIGKSGGGSVNYNVDNGGTIIISKDYSSSKPTSVGQGCTVADGGDNWIITKE